MQTTAQTKRHIARVRRAMLNVSNAERLLVLARRELQEAIEACYEPTPRTAFTNADVHEARQVMRLEAHES